MNVNLDSLFNSHSEWLETEGKTGEQIVLEKICSNSLTNKQLHLLTDAILTQCSFSDTKLNGNDFYHTEIYSCEFNKVSFHEVQFIKSEVNDTKFTNANFNTVNFSNIEMFDCIFTKCAFNNSTFINAGIWDTSFDNCTFTNVDFESAYIENITFVNPEFINPVNLDKSTKIVLNIGTAKKPYLLSHEESIRWITEHSRQGEK